MPSLPKMSKRDAIPLTTFYDLLHTWLTTTNEPTVGDVDNHTGHTPWVWVTASGQHCRLHADSQREGIATLLRLKREADHLEWHIVANNRGNFNKVAFGPSKEVIPGVYLYLAKPIHHGRRLISGNLTSPPPPSPSTTSTAEPPHSPQSSTSRTT